MAPVAKCKYYPIENHYTKMKDIYYLRKCIFKYDQMKILGLQKAPPEEHSYIGIVPLKIFPILAILIYVK